LQGQSGIMPRIYGTEKKAQQNGHGPMEVVRNYSQRYEIAASLRGPDSIGRPACADSSEQRFFRELKCFGGEATPTS
jgi:hypothetical protein